MENKDNIQDIKLNNKKPDTAGSGNYSQAKIRKGLTLAVTIFAALLIICVALIIVVSKKIEAGSGADAQIRLSAQVGFTCEYSEAQKLYPYGEGVIKVTSERIAYLTISGSEVFTYSIAYQNPQCYIDGNLVAVYDRDGYSFTVLDSNGIWYSKPTTYPVKAIQLSDEGFAAVISGTEESFGEMTLYDKSGNQLAEWSTSTSGYPLCCSFNEDSTQLAVSTINTSGAVIVPYVRVFSISTKSDKTYEITDSAVYTTPNNVIFAALSFVDGKLCCFTSNSMYEVKDDNLTQINFDFSAIGFVKNVDDYLFITYSDGVSQLNRLAVIDSSDRIIYNSNIGSNIVCVANNDRLYAISVDRRVFIFNTDGVITNDYSVDEEIIRMNFIDGDKLCVVSTSGVHTIN